MAGDGNEEHAEPGEMVDRRIVVRLLNMIGQRKTCERCGRTIWWARSYRHSCWVPFDGSGNRHPINCKDASAARDQLIDVS